MKKVEVYFLINLGAILSLFAIEGELSIYMQRQDDILKNVCPCHCEQKPSFLTHNRDLSARRVRKRLSHIFVRS